MIQITNKTDLDPVVDIPMVDAYMRWALMAAEEMLGRKQLDALLQERGLDRFIGNYPPEKLQINRKITVGDYAELCTALSIYFGENAQSKSIEIGKLATKPAMEKQGKVFNFAAKAAVKVLPSSLQIKTVLDSIQGDIEKIYKGTEYDVNILVEDRGDKWAYIDGSCAVCAGKLANSPICWSWTGTLEESLMWLTGKTFDVSQVECRASGDRACVWEIDKAPKV